MGPASGRRRFLHRCAAALAFSLAGCATTTQNTTTTQSTQSTPATTTSSTETTTTDTGPLSPGEWPMFAFNPQNTGRNPDAVGPKHAITERWRFQTESWVESSPTIANQTLYITSRDRRVYALDARTGEERWRFATGIDTTDNPDTQPSEEAMRSSPAVVDGTVYVGGGNREVRHNDAERETVSRHIYLYALDAESGDLEWRFQPEGLIEGAPTVVAGVVYFGCTAGNLYALDTQDGSEHWRVTTDGKFTAAPAIHENTLYAGNWNGSLYALDTHDGSERWTYRASGPVSAAPTLANTHVYIGVNGSGQVIALSTTDGTESWTYDAGGSIVASSPAVADGVVYIGDYSGQHDEAADRLHAIDASTGESVWMAQTPGYIWASPAVVDGVVYVGDLDGMVAGFDADTGELLWQYTAQDNNRSSPAVAGNTLYIGSDDGHVYALTEH